MFTKVLPKSANKNKTSSLCEYIIDFYEFLPRKLSCEDLLIEIIKLWPPPIKDMANHPPKFLVLVFGM